MLIVRTPVRISFAGGGTDLPSYYEKHGGMVLSTSIDKYVYTVLTERDDGRIQIISSDLRTLETCDQISRMELQGTDLEIPFAVLKHFKADVGVNLFLASEVPPGTGLGSSAAVCVNLLKTLSAYLGRELSERELAENAFHVARNILRRPVGKQDEYASAFGALNVMKFTAEGTEVEPLRLSSELILDLEQSLMLFFTGSARNSSEILAAQEQSIRSREADTVEALTDLKNLVPEMREALASGSVEVFGRLLDESWRIKKQVSSGISNPTIDRMYEIARSRGALGGKITGAGGGGFLLLFCERERQDDVRSGLREFGLKEMRFHLDFGGTKVVYNDPFFDSDGHGGMRWVLSPALEGSLA
ncbi:MAG TPA: GHMP kinase [Terriglobia bacterium]|nr:GHMP kinase [Terriglobia bacterium]